jgi:YD repeat-containing protein
VTASTRYSGLAGSSKVGASLYQYDPGMRLTTIQHESGTAFVLVSMVYSYDAASCVASQSIAGTATNYSYDALNQLTTVTASGTTTYGYDNNGNRNGPGYVVRADNQITFDGTWSYTYDGEGNVTKKQNPSTGETWNYTYDDANELTGVTDVSGSGTTLMQATYVYDAFGTNSGRRR